MTTLAQAPIAASVAGAVLAMAGGAWADAPVVLNWEDLMPEGEYELVEDLRQAYYDEIAAQWDAAPQVPLSQMGGLADGSLDPIYGEPIGADPLSGDPFSGDAEGVDPLSGEVTDEDDPWAGAWESDPWANDPFAAIPEGSDADFMPQLGTFNTVDDLHGLTVRMPGYVVPLDFNRDHRYREFLLVPYPGACLHTPPPPPNQIVYVTAEDAPKVEHIWEPVWVIGVMTTQRADNDLGNAAYSLTLSSLENYYY